MSQESVQCSVAAVCMLSNATDLAIVVAGFVAFCRQWVNTIVLIPGISGNDISVLSLTPGHSSQNSALGVCQLCSNVIKLSAHDIGGMLHAIVHKGRLLHFCDHSRTHCPQSRSQTIFPYQKVWPCECPFNTCATGVGLWLWHYPDKVYIFIAMSAYWQTYSQGTVLRELQAYLLQAYLVLHPLSAPHTHTHERVLADWVGRAGTVCVLQGHGRDKQIYDHMAAISTQ